MSCKQCMSGVRGSGTMCSDRVDYSRVTGERILPFLFVLDREESVLDPGEGQKQKFCYDVEGVGEDSSRFADLSHFLLGICKAIRKEDIAEITVTVDGEEQTVVWGSNVEIKTEEKPDPPTGCVGLKFDFPLSKTDGHMHVCITMERPFGVGPVNVCVFGGNVTATGLMICGPVCGGDQSCETVFFQQETVCVPVRVMPFAEPGEPRTVCCGDPVVSTGGECAGGRSGCTFTVTQTLCLEIPIVFGAHVETGDAVVACGGVSDEPCPCLEGSAEGSAVEVPAAVTAVPQSQQDINDRRFFYRR